jgi:hypothetical protein
MTYIFEGYKIEQKSKIYLNQKKIKNKNTNMCVYIYIYIYIYIHIHIVTCKI